MLKIFNVTNNYNHICENCLIDVKRLSMYQPASFIELEYGTCESCGFIKFKSGLFAIWEYAQINYPYHNFELLDLEFGQMYNFETYNDWAEQFYYNALKV